MYIQKKKKMAEREEKEENGTDDKDYKGGNGSQFIKSVGCQQIILLVVDQFLFLSHFGLFLSLKEVVICCPVHTTVFSFKKAIFSAFSPSVHATLMTVFIGNACV